MNERPYPIKTTAPDWEDGWSLSDYTIALQVHIKNLALQIRLLNEYINHIQHIQPDDPAVAVFVRDVVAELSRARSLFPGDRVMTIALVEEVGELCKALLDESPVHVRREAIQVATMAARVVLDGDSSVSDLREERGLSPLIQREETTDA